MLASWRYKASKHRLAIISSYYFYSSTESSRSSKHPLIHPILKPTYIVTITTERSLPSIVTYPTPPACYTSASIHFTPNSHKLFSLIVTIYTNSSTCPTSRSIYTTHCSSTLNTILLSHSKKQLVHLSTVILPLALSSFSPTFTSSPTSAYYRVILQFSSSRFTYTHTCSTS